MLNIEHIIKQKSYEKPVHLLRRHPIVFIRTIITFLLLTILPYIFYLVLKPTLDEIITGKLTLPVAVLAASIYYLSICLFFFSHFLDYYLDLWIVTNERIVNIEQIGLFSRTVSELDLYKIQDVTSDIKGMTPTFFNYGNVYIQTAAEKERFSFEQIADPHKIRQSIIDLIEIDRKYHLNELQAKDVSV